MSQVTGEQSFIVAASASQIAFLKRLYRTEGITPKWGVTINSNSIIQAVIFTHETFRRVSILTFLFKQVHDLELFLQFVVPSCST